MSDSIICYVRISMTGTQGCRPGHFNEVKCSSIRGKSIFISYKWFFFIYIKIMIALVIISIIMFIYLKKTHELLHCNALNQ